MNLTRRNFFKLGAGAFAGASFLLPAVTTAQTDGSLNALPSATLADPLLYLTGADFKKQLGTQFLLFTGGTGTIAAVLSKVTQTVARRGGGGNPNQPAAEAFSLSFRMPFGVSQQGTYLLRHQRLGQFNLFLVPEAGSERYLHAVINRI